MHGPLSDRASLLRVAVAVLEAARASMRWADLATVIGSRFGVDPRMVPASTPVDDLDRATLVAHGEHSFVYFMKGIHEAVDIGVARKHRRADGRVELPNLRKIAGFSEIFDPIVFAPIINLKTLSY